MFEAMRSYIEGRSLLQLSRDALDVFLVYYLCIARSWWCAVRAPCRSASAWASLRHLLGRQQAPARHRFTIMNALIGSMILIIVVLFQSDIRRGLQRVAAVLARAPHALAGIACDRRGRRRRDRPRASPHRRSDRLRTGRQLDEFVGVHRVTRSTLRSPRASWYHCSFRAVKSSTMAPSSSATTASPRPACSSRSRGPNRGRQLGSRHRAALGITEETDAVVVIVSEERGTISFCFNGNIASNLDGPKLKTMLEAIFSPRVRKKSRRSRPIAKPIAKFYRERAHPEPPSRSGTATPSSSIRASLVADTTDAPAAVARAVSRLPIAPPLTGPPPARRTPQRRCARR